MKYFKKPLTLDEIRKLCTHDTQISGIIALTQDEVLSTSLDTFIDLLSLKLCGSKELKDIDYTIINTEDGLVYYKVTVDAYMLL